jgi:hypothetical protein
MQAWIDAVCAELGITAEVDIDAVLAVARDAAHMVERPAAPVSTYLLGIAAASGADVSQAAERIGELAKGWSAPA